MEPNAPGTKEDADAAAPPGKSIEFDCQRRFSGGFRLAVAFRTRRLVTGIYGPSGSGKTTILNLLAGFVRPDAGHARLGERTLFDSRRQIDEPPERRRVGFVFQDHLLFPHLSVAANLRYGVARGRGRANAALSGRLPSSFERVVEVLELGALLDRFPRNLSGGERQRVALGRALVSEPEALLLDEPLAALDAELKSQVMEYLAAVIARWRIPTLLVSHDAGEIRRLCQWTFSLAAGKLIGDGPPADLPPVVD